MTKKLSFRKENLPTYIERLKSMVARNYEIMVKPIENYISVDKYHNIVKGRRMATDQSIKGLKKIDSCYKELDNIPENELSSYYRENLEILIENLKATYLLNLDIIDIELDPNEEEKHELFNVSGELKEMFGDKITNNILKAVSNGEITEDKVHNVIKGSEMAYEDCDWIMTKIEELESELNTEEVETTKESWAIKGLVEE